MADQRRWFKLWVSALDDPALGSLSVADFGRWCRFGAYLAQHGTHGSIVLSEPPAGGTHPVQSLLQEVSFKDALGRLLSFPNCDVLERYGPPVTWLVSWRNWKKYQEETTWERMRRFRAKAVTAKRGGEERRGYKKRRKEESPGDLRAQLAASALTEASPNGPVFRIPESIQTALTRAPKLGAVTRITSTTFWQAEIRANGSVDLPTEILKAEAWLTAHPEKHYKNLSAFLHNWLGRADRPEE